MGRLKVNLRNECGRRVCVNVATLVLTAFAGPRPADMQCCHSDGNHLNNSASNLRWDTAKANHADMAKHGTRRIGEKNHAAKLTANDVMQIRARHALTGESQCKLAKEYGVCQYTIMAILRRETWAHV
jgi:hypothetical protein